MTVAGCRKCPFRITSKTVRTKQTQEPKNPAETRYIKICPLNQDIPL